MDRDPHTAQISRRRRIIINAQSESVLLKIFRVLLLIQIDGTWLARVLKKTADNRRPKTLSLVSNLTLAFYVPRQQLTFSEPLCRP